MLLTNMEETTTDSLLEAAAGAAASRAVEAFAILGNETRLSILLALWEVYEPFAEDNAISFSELRNRVGMRDSGQFNYHLDKLAGHFIRKTDNGYELRRAGYQLVGTVIAGTGFEEPTLDSTEIDRECGRCGAPTEVTYQDGELYLVCAECDGLYERNETGASGVIAYGDFDPTGLTDRTPHQAWNAMLTTLKRRALSAVEGVCVLCSGPTDISLDICEEHDSDGVCDNCGREWALMTRSRCPICKNHETGPPSWFVSVHPEVISFYNERGVSLQYEFGDYEGLTRRTGQSEQELVSDDPIQVRVSYEYEGDRVEILVDEEMNVLEINEPD